MSSFTPDRRSFLLSATAGLVTIAAAPMLARAETPALMVWKDPYCGCCGGWVRHMQSAGYAAQVSEVEDMAAIKARLGVPSDLQSCHTAELDGYVLEGHVPPRAVEKLLRERPDVAGLAVPGMPLGSPGMETDGAAEVYDVVAFGPSGAATFMRFQGSEII